jgi:3-oxoacyl-[acyl-carrier protein] reductase
MQELAGKVALVTGAGGGIGRAICRKLSSQGVLIAAVDNRKEPLQSLVGEINYHGGKATMLVGDVSSRYDVSLVVSGCLRAFGRLDILVNNAGINPTTPVWDNIPEKEWDDVFAVNLKGPYYCMCEASVPMKNAKWGRIINIGSIAGKLGGLLSGLHYCASKAALMCLTKNFARLLAPYAITVNAVAPGIIDTDMTRSWPEDSKKSYLKENPLGRMGCVDEVAHAVAYLASPLAGYVNGEIMDVNGGQLMD